MVRRDEAGVCASKAGSGDAPVFPPLSKKTDCREIAL